MFKNPGTKWPIIIVVSIIGVIGVGAWTIKVAFNNPVEMSQYGMQNYHEYDRDVNEIIKAKIAFDQKYTISFLTPQINEKKTVLEYSLADKSGQPINNAKINVILTRPDVNKFDLNLSNPTIKEGRYSFAPVDLPKAGRWDIMAKVIIGEDKRFYNLKADTRKPNTLEF